MKLFTLGPVEMHDYTRKIAAEPLPYFRTAEFSDYMLGLEKVCVAHDLIFGDAQHPLHVGADVIQLFRLRVQQQKHVVRAAGEEGGEDVYQCGLVADLIVPFLD